MLYTYITLLQHIYFIMYDAKFETARTKTAKLILLLNYPGERQTQNVASVKIWLAYSVFPLYLHQWRPIKEILRCANQDKNKIKIVFEENL